MTQIEIDGQGYLCGIFEGCGTPGGMDVDPAALEEIDRELMTCYRWVDGAAVLDQEKAAIEREKQQNPPPTAEERITELEAALNLLLKGDGL